MDDFRDFELCEPAPFLFSDDGHVAITDGNNVWMVIVTSPQQRSAGAMTKMARSGYRKRMY